MIKLNPGHHNERITVAEYLVYPVPGGAEVYTY